jgi:hypothetical protein
MSLGSSMEGLAQQMAQPAAGQQPEGMPTIEQIIQMLMQGVDPEEMIQMGIPPELIMQAIEILEQQMAAQAQPEQGLAAKTVGGM